MRVPDGLWRSSLGSILDFMSANGFNSLRLFFSMQNLAENKRTPSHFDEHGSPQLAGTDYLGMLAAISQEAARHGIVVLLANHQIKSGYPDEWPGEWDGNWFDETYQPERILELWTKLATRLCNDDLWNIMGVE
jgi:aryl-phospho-beta-D-glucosidase BglC (GH1 family)